MSASAIPPGGGLSLRGWWPLLGGVVALLLVSYVRFIGGLWSAPGNDHAPILVAIALFVFWHHRDALAKAQPSKTVWPAAVLLGLGLLMFLFGVRTKIGSFEAFSHVLLLSGVLLLAGGTALLLRLWFALLFLLLSVPIPTFLLSIATEGLKSNVTTAAVQILYSLGYPIARDGAMITIGYYQLLVAEACSGMNSIISLSAIGLLYLYLVPPRRLWQLLVCLASILPIAVGANVLRIVILSLITYHFGDEAGQGFLHEFAGMVMFLFALATVIGLATLLARIPAPGATNRVEASRA